MTANASEPGANDPKYWRPDLESANTVVTSISSPLGQSVEGSSQEALSPHGARHKHSVSVQQSFRVSKGGFINGAYNGTPKLPPANERRGYGPGYRGFKYEF